MRMTHLKHKLSILLCIVLIAAMALLATGCINSKEPVSSTPTISQTQSTELGQGATAFTFTVVDGEGKETVFLIHTDKKIVGEALQELQLIDGEEGPYGLYVKTVNGLTVDYDKDGKYWAFYANDQYASAGVDVTEITPDTKYSFKVE